MQEYRAEMVHGEPKGSRQLNAGNYHCLLFVLRGSVQYRSKTQHWTGRAEDLFLMKPGESVTLELPEEKEHTEMIGVWLSPQLLGRISDENTDLERAFHVIPLACMLVHADSEAVMLIKNLAYRLVHLEEEKTEYGETVFEDGLLKMFVVLVLRACIRSEQHRSKASRGHLMLDELFRFIHAHLLEDITLERLEEKFYISRCHIAREFKRQTGESVHQYIVKSRLDLCLGYIEQGLPITEVYKRSGFNDYNNFFRAFKKQYGMTPRQYFRTTQENARVRENSDGKLEQKRNI